MHTGARAREQKYISIYISLCMKTFLKTGVYERSGPEVNSKPCKKPEKNANFYFLELFLQQVLYLFSFYSLSFLFFSFLFFFLVLFNGMQISFFLFFFIDTCLVFAHIVKGGAEPVF